VANDSLKSVKKYLSENKRSFIIIACLLLGVFFLFSSPSAFGEEKGETDRAELSEYKAALEKELSEVCSSVKGVGRCRVTVTFSRGEGLIYKGSTLLESRPPKVMGVTVVCKGADSDAVRAEIVGMMTALFDIGANRVSVLKLN
jgi:hypothetical protein